MLFEDKKLHLESIDQMIQCPISSVQPYSLMLSPVYVLMKLNKKLVSVKAPLDFFTEQELKRLSVNEVFYLPKFAGSSVRFQTAARVIHNIFTIRQDQFLASPFEISKESFGILAPLWGKQFQVEPFFMSVFAEELCSPLDPQMMLWARENAVVRHDHGLLLSGSLVFIAAHLGWSNLKELNEIRSSVYEKTVKGEDWKTPRSELELIVSGLNELFEAHQNLSVDILKTVQSEWSKKILARLNRLEGLNTNQQYDSLTIYGEDGFAA